MFWLIAQTTTTVPTLPAWEILLILAGFLGSFVTLTIFIVKWMAGRMDVKDGRYAEMTKADRDDYLKMNRESQDRYIDITEKYQSVLSTRAEQFLDMSTGFKQTVDEFMKSACSNIEQVAKAQMDFHAEWMKKQAELREALDIQQEKDDKVVAFLTNGFLDPIRAEHQGMINQLERIARFTTEVEREHDTMLENNLAMIEQMKLQGETLCKVCEALDITLKNGNGHVWDGVERRSIDA